jgi:hypothetical protein
MMKNLLKAAASLSVAGVIVAGAAMPALAATGTNEAYAAAASGLISINPPLADATFPGTSPANLANINVTGLLTAGVVNDAAGPTSASSSIANAAVRLTALAALRADAVTSSCNFDTTNGTVSGTASITNGRVTVGGVTTVTLAANPAPNTTISVPGIATIVLNQQSTDGSGTLTVNAISVTLLRGTQTLTLGTSICNKATLAPVAALPGMAMPIGLGVAGLLGVAGVAYYFSKRRRFVAAA